MFNPRPRPAISYHYRQVESCRDLFVFVSIHSSDGSFASFSVNTNWLIPGLDLKHILIQRPELGITKGHVCTTLTEVSSYQASLRLPFNAHMELLCSDNFGHKYHKLCLVRAWRFMKCWISVDAYNTYRYIVNAKYALVNLDIAPPRPNRFEKSTSVIGIIRDITKVC